MLVCVAGADGAGKSTVTKLIARQMTDRGSRIERVDRWDIVANQAYPAARFIRPDVPDTRLCVADMPPLPRFLFLMWSMGMALLGRQHGTGAPDVTLLDGYWMKHAASEIVYGLQRSWVEAVTDGLPRADAVIYLRLDPATAWQRKRHGDIVPYECGMDPACAPGTFLAHQREIGSILDLWAARNGWIEVDAGAPLEDVEKAVTGALAALAGGKGATGG